MVFWKTWRLSKAWIESLGKLLQIKCCLVMETPPPSTQDFHKATNFLGKLPLQSAFPSLQLFEGRRRWQAGHNIKLQLLHHNRHTACKKTKTKNKVLILKQKKYTFSNKLKIMATFCCFLFISKRKGNTSFSVNGKIFK